MWIELLPVIIFFFRADNYFWYDVVYFSSKISRYLCTHRTVDICVCTIDRTKIIEELFYILTVICIHMIRSKGFSTIPYHYSLLFGSDGLNHIFPLPSCNIFTPPVPQHSSHYIPSSDLVVVINRCVTGVKGHSVIHGRESIYYYLIEIFFKTNL